MHSSASVTCRALAMLTCAITIPLVAMFGGLAGDLIQGLWTGQESCPQEALSEAPPCEVAKADQPPPPSQVNSPSVHVFEPPKSRDMADDAILASFETSAGRALPTPPGPDEMEYIQQRLRQLGATYYVLESWGSEGSYRFSCRIAIGGNPLYTRCFEATGRDGLSAMSTVLRQVEALH